jgi:hypothetical protein
LFFLKHIEWLTLIRPVEKKLKKVLTGTEQTLSFPFLPEGGAFFEKKDVSGL